MPYESVDQLQRTLAEDVFHYATDSKKAAGRALGTLVEVITFYLLKSWKFEPFIQIEYRLPEFGNHEIEHNVEYTLQPCKFIIEFKSSISKPITASKLVKIIRHKVDLSSFRLRKNTLLTTDDILRNSCIIAENSELLFICLLNSIKDNEVEFSLVAQYKKPFAMFECKRVGIEEGNKKGPQTIEKAKQGAYVANSVSSLQKIRTPSGILHGVIYREDESLYSKPYSDLFNEIVNSTDPDLLKDFILTVGVVSNHGNWFTSDNHNKELEVLAQSYDWLLFLSDRGLSEFISDVIISPDNSLLNAKNAFLESYKPDKKQNQFTKVKMNRNADIALREYFSRNIERIEAWFEIITPKDTDISALKRQISELAGKDWQRILE